MKPKKLIRSLHAEKLPAHEIETVTDKKQLNELYYLKVREELEEIKSSGFKDILEFADLIEVAVRFAALNGFDGQLLEDAMTIKVLEKGSFSDVVLNNLNPNNPSNKIYFEIDKSKSRIITEL